jgi:hypothetical protein
MPASMHRNADERVASESFLESTFIDQNNPKRQTAGPHWGSPKLDLSELVYGGLPGVGPWPDSRF